MNKIIILFFLIGSYSYGQDKICQCAIINSLDESDYEDFFQPKILAEKGIVQVEWISINENSAERDQLKFDANGKVILKEIYYRDTLWRYTKYERNQSGMITKETSGYISYRRKIMEEWGKQITDYTYDQSGRLIEKRDRGYEGEIISDSKTRFERYTYDTQNRIVDKLINQAVYADPIVPTITVYKTTTQYPNDSTSVSTNFTDGKQNGMEKQRFDKLGNLVRAEHYYSFTKKIRPTTSYFYNSDQRLIKLATKGYASECIDGGVFENEYFYEEDLLKSIKHHYGAVNCKVVFSYK